MSKRCSIRIQFSVERNVNVDGCPDSVPRKKKKFPSIVERVRDYQVAQLRQEWQSFNAEQKNRRIHEEVEPKLTTCSLPALQPLKEKPLLTATTDKIIAKTDTTKLAKSPSPVKTVRSPDRLTASRPPELEDQPPLVIPASPIPEPVDEPLITPTVFQSIPTQPIVFSAFQTGPSVVFPQQTSHQAVQPFGMTQQQRRIVKANRTRRFDEIEAPSNDVQRRQTFGNYGRPEIQQQFQYNEQRPSDPIMSMTGNPNPPAPAPAPPQPSWNMPNQQFQQPGPGFAPQQETAPVAGFSIGRLATPKRPQNKARRRAKR
eukprot:g1309.t1